MGVRSRMVTRTRIFWYVQSIVRLFDDIDYHPISSMLSFQELLCQRTLVCHDQLILVSAKETAHVTGTSNTERCCTGVVAMGLCQRNMPKEGF